MSKQVLLIAAVLACLDGTVTRAEEPLRVGRFRQLFVDDLVIADRSNVELNLHQPVLLTSKIVKFLTKLSSGDGVKLLQRYVLGARQGRVMISRPLVVT